MDYDDSDNWVHFGDLNLAQVFDFKNYVDDDDGLEYIEFLLRPSNRLVSKYPELINEVDDEGLLTREFKTSEVIHVPGGINRNRWLVFKDINDKETEVSGYFAKASVVINDLRRLLKTEKYAKYRILQELDEERSQKETNLKQQSKLMKAVAEGRGRVDQESFIGEDNE